MEGKKKFIKHHRLFIPGFFTLAILVILSFSIVSYSETKNLFLRYGESVSSTTAIAQPYLRSLTQSVLTLGIIAVALGLIAGFLISKYYWNATSKLHDEVIDMHSIINYSPFGIYTVLPTGEIDSFNSKMLEISGIKKATEIIGLNVFKLNSYKAANLDKYIQRGLDGESFEVETPYTSAITNKYSYRRYIGTPIFDRDNKTVIKLLLFVEELHGKVKIEDLVRRERQTGISTRLFKR